MFAARDTPQNSTGFTPFELLYGHKVRTPMMLLKRIWTDEDEDPEVKTLYQYVSCHKFLLGQLSLASLRGRLIEYRLRLG